MPLSLHRHLWVTPYHQGRITDSTTDPRLSISRIQTVCPRLRTSAAFEQSCQKTHFDATFIFTWMFADVDADRESDVGRAVALSLVGECSREGCMRPRARNPRTQVLHDYCSLWCAAAPQAKPNVQDNSTELHSNKPVTMDDSMDLAIALEMSRLQMIEDTVKRQHQLVFFHLCHIMAIWRKGPA